eukprot:5243616-Pyramimonas_sp.AAC.1
MAHVEPPTWANSRIGGTGQFLEPLCSITWVWVCDPDTCHGHIVGIVVQYDSNAASCPSAFQR